MVTIFHIKQNFNLYVKLKNINIYFKLFLINKSLREEGNVIFLNTKAFLAFKYKTLKPRIISLVLKSTKKCHYAE